MRVALIVALAACHAAATSPVAVAPTVAEVPMSDPADYAIDHVSRAAGEAIFTRTGIGDPYRTGVPYPIFLSLLRAFPQILGGTPAELAGKFGFLARTPDPASDDLDVREGLPIGMHLTIDPLTDVPFVVTNCALCHAERLHWQGGDALVIGLGNKRVQIHAYDAAFAALTRAHGFTGEHLGRLAGEAAAAHGIAWPERYREILVAATVAALTKRAADRAELVAHTSDAPPGRVATIESFALVLGQLTHRGVVMTPTVGWAKVPDVIGFPVRTTLSWDGSGEGPMDLLAVEADVAAGVRVAWLERHPFQGASLGAYLRQPAPRPAFPGRIDRALAERGHSSFDDNCAPCHGTYGADGRARDYHEQIVELSDLGTDPARAQAATESFELAANDQGLTRGYTRFRRTNGYVPPVLTNVWARAPYGHAGQWPSLAVLATPPEKRPTHFTFAFDAPYDLEAVGVATTGAGYAEDATRPGLSALGHPFLADLGVDAPAVIEYLKTL